MCDTIIISDIRMVSITKLVDSQKIIIKELKRRHFKSEHKCFFQFVKNTRTLKGEVLKCLFVCDCGKAKEKKLTWEY